jgi:hypothetical protein
MIDHSAFIEAADEAVEHLRHLRKRYPALVSTHVREAIDNWDSSQFKRGDLEFIEAGAKAPMEDALAAAAIDMIQVHQLEDVMEMLSEEFSVEVDYEMLIRLVGGERYVKALKQEAIDLKLNKVSYEQTADLWNSMGKPAPGGGPWSARSVSQLSR